MSRKTRVLLLVVLLASADIIWLKSSVEKAYLEESMYARFREGAGWKIKKIHCYAAGVDRPKLACNYLSSDKSTWDVKHIDLPSLVNAPIAGWFVSSFEIREIYYQRDSPGKVQLTFDVFFNPKKFRRADVYWFDAVVHGILAGQPL